MPSSNPLLRNMVGWIPYDVIPMGSASNQQLKPFNQVQVLCSSSSAGATPRWRAPTPPAECCNAPRVQSPARSRVPGVAEVPTTRTAPTADKEALSLVLMDQRAL